MATGRTDSGALPTGATAVRGRGSGRLDRASESASSRNRVVVISGGGLSVVVETGVVEDLKKKPKS